MTTLRGAKLTVHARRSAEDAALHLRPLPILSERELSDLNAPN